MVVKNENFQELNLNNIVNEILDLIDENIGN